MAHPSADLPHRAVALGLDLVELDREVDPDFPKVIDKAIHVSTPDLAGFTSAFADLDDPKVMRRAWS